MVEDEAVELGGMSEGAHMARTGQERELGVGQRAGQQIGDGAGRRPRLAAGDEKRRRGDLGVVL